MFCKVRAYEHVQKIGEKSEKNQCKFPIGKWMIKNRYQIRFERLGGSIWKGLGTVWGVFWALLGVFWRFSWTFGINTFGNIGPRWALRACWDRFWDGFGWVWEGLERVWEGLGGSWGPFGKFGGGFLGVTWGFLGALVSKTYSGGYFCTIAGFFLLCLAFSVSLLPSLAFFCFCVDSLAFSCFFLLRRDIVIRHALSVPSLLRFWVSWVLFLRFFRIFGDI